MQVTAEASRGRFDRAVNYLEICARRHGLAHRDELLASELSKDVNYGLVRSGRLVRELPRVYRAKGVPRSWIQIVAAVSLWAGPDTGVTGPAAAALYGVDGFRHKGPIDLLTRATDGRRGRTCGSAESSTCLRRICGTAKESSSSRRPGFAWTSHDD